ncbi:MAG: 23S rRNA (adenine(2030)-N(6))-methyltransferase RlmJ [Methylococcaceae bacterium]|nr:MAG: 23S rRNA (adenine(2030)-N(6))-methyltransferase RlmJ [Methylococcaceae bacterium]
MLSYRHIFHAGNFADVCKHATLSLLIQALKRKDKPFFYLDTHAGAGRYDLLAGAAQKNQEHGYGIAKLWERDDAPALLKPYLQTIASLNSAGKLRYYPGSPCLVQQLLRKQDRMVLCELHPTDFAWLDQEFGAEARVTVQSGDGYQALKAFLPPRERRGLVFIDPAFELKDERDRLAKALIMAYQRWPTGIFAIWLPMTDPNINNAVYRRLRDAGIAKVLLAELCIGPESPALGMYGTGMIIINPPWKLDQELGRVLPYLHQVLAEKNQGSWRVRWLAHEAKPETQQED